MKKLFILITALILFLSVSTVCAGLFGPSITSCNKFSIEIPQGFSETEVSNSAKDFISLGTGVPSNGETNRFLKMYEVSSSDKENGNATELLRDNWNIVENHTENNLLVEKCQNDRRNFTYAEFSKDRHNYELYIDWDGDLEKLNLSDDVNLVKKIMESTEHK